MIHRWLLWAFAGVITTAALTTMLLLKPDTSPRVKPTPVSVADGDRISGAPATEPPPPTMSADNLPAPPHLTDPESQSEGTHLGREFGLFWREHGVSGVLDAMESGAFDYSVLAPQSRRKLARLLVRAATPAELHRLLEMGALTLNVDAIQDVTSRLLKNDVVDQAAVIKKIELLSTAGYSPAHVAHLIYGNRTAFDKAVTYGLDEVARHLSGLGVASAAGEETWTQCLRSRFCTPDIAELLTQLGYSPSSEDLRMIRDELDAIQNAELVAWLRAQYGL